MAKLATSLRAEKSATSTSSRDQSREWRRSAQNLHREGEGRRERERARDVKSREKLDFILASVVFYPRRWFGGCAAGSKMVFQTPHAALAALSVQREMGVVKPRKPHPDNQPLP